MLAGFSIDLSPMANPPGSPSRDDYSYANGNELAVQCATLRNRVGREKLKDAHRFLSLGMPKIQYECAKDDFAVICARTFRERIIETYKDDPNALKFAKMADAKLVGYFRSTEFAKLIEEKLERSATPPLSPRDKV